MFYMVKMLDVYDAYFYYYSLYIVTRLKICRHMAEKVGDFSSEFNTTGKQTELLVKLIKTHEDVKRFRINTKKSIQINETSLYLDRYTAEFSKSFVILILGEGVTAMAQLTIALLMNSWVRFETILFAIALRLCVMFPNSFTGSGIQPGNCYNHNKSILFAVPFRRTDSTQCKEDTEC